MTQSAKRTRRTRAELRQLMLEAGKAVLLQLPPTMGFEELTYARVFEHVLHEHGQKVTTGSVHERIWESQRSYQLDVLAQLLEEVPERIFDIANSGAIQALEHADLTTPAGRRYAAQNITRLLQNGSWELDTDAEAHEAIALAVRFRLARLEPDHPESQVFSKLLFEQRQHTTQLYADMMMLLMDAIGLRFKSDHDAYGVDMISVLGNALTTGLITDVMPLARQAKLLPTGPNGELEEWQPSALGVWFIVRSMLELDDDSLSESERSL